MIWAADAQFFCRGQRGWRRRGDVFMAGQRHQPQCGRDDMNDSSPIGLRAAAADWLARLDRPDVGEADWIAFDAWLEAAPEHKLAYDEVLALWSDVEAAAPSLDQALTPPRAPASRRWVLAGGLAAAGLVAAITPWSDFTAPTVTYQTARGERQSVTLSDGTRIDLNAGSRLTVRLTGRERRVAIDGGQAIFDVAKDPRRPFLIEAGDRTVRVVGTQFDVRYRDGRQSVTVARGVVEVRPTAGAGKAYRLTVGQRLDHMAGAPDAEVTAGSPQAVFAWRSGKLVYRDEPLANVVADLNQYADRPIRLADARTGRLPFSGVLVTADGADMVQTLTLVAPVTSTTTPEGLLLRAK